MPDRRAIAVERHAQAPATARKRLVWVPIPRPPGSPTVARLRATVAERGERARLVAVAVAVVRVLSQQPGLSLRKLRASVRSVLGHCTDADTDAAVELLGPGVQRSEGERGASLHTLVIERVPRNVLARVKKGT
jgi:hypothetical protein